MAGINKLLLLSTFFFFQGIYSYCVYNMLTDGSSFKVMQVESGASWGKVFRHHMEKDQKFCCPYTEQDCSCSLTNDDEAIFSASFIICFAIELYFSSGYPPIKIVRCTTGGALVIGGTQDNYYAECIDANGFSTMMPFEEPVGRIVYYESQH